MSKSVVSAHCPSQFGTIPISNILSLLGVAQDCHLTMDTSVENAIWLHRDDGQILKCVECAGVLYAHDRSNPSHKITTRIVKTQTVESCKSEYTHRQVA